MEEKKELGLGWYEFLRYFPFGLLRIFSFLSIISNLGLMYNNKDNLTIITHISFVCIICDFIFRVVVHNHLENYSTNTTNAMLLYYINRTINGMLNTYVNYSFLASLFIPVFFGMLYFINYRYFKKRSNIFINECGFWGKVKKEKFHIVIHSPHIEENRNVMEKNEIIKNRYCRKCGAELLEGSKFCHKCGTETVDL